MNKPCYTIDKKKNDKKKSSAAKTKIKKAHIVFPPLEQEHKSLRAVRRALGHWRSVSLSSGHGRGRLGFALAVSAGASRLALQQSQPVWDRPPSACSSQLEKC